MQPQPTAGYPPHSYAYGGYPQQPQTTSAAPPPAISTVPSSAAAQQYSLPVSAHPGVVYNTQQAWVHQAGPPPAETPVHQQLPIYSPQQQQHPQRQHPQQHSLPQQFGGYVTDSPAPGYGHHYAAPAPPPPPPPPLPAAAATTAAPAPSQHHEQQAVCLPLQATPQQPLPAGPGQSLAAYAYPGTSEVAATGQEQQQQQQHPEYQQQQEQQEQQPPQQLSTPQQVAQQAIAKTLASMQQQQNQALAFDNRRGYLHGNLIGKMEKARLERAAEKNENYVRRKDEIARRKRLGLPLDGLIDPKLLAREAAGDSGAAGKPKLPPRGPAMASGGGQNRAGIGTAGARAPNTSVYITGLPRDVEQSKIELVFSQHGKVKRVKLYRDEAGQAKGDGLVTYAKPVSADLAIVKLNGHEITPGHPILVSMADFNWTKAGTTEDSHQDWHEDGEGDNDDAAAAGASGTDVGGKKEGSQAWSGEGDLPSLPEECEADKYPVVVLRNVYSKEEAEADPDFYDDLEADMLMECVKFGTVVRVATPETPGYFGSVCITFESSKGADACVQAMHGRWFDQRQIEALVMGARVVGKDEEDQKPAPTDALQETAAAYEDVPSKPDSPLPSDLSSFLASV